MKFIGMNPSLLKISKDRISDACNELLGQLSREWNYHLETE